MAASATLKKITSRAKHIRRIHGGTWKGAIKKAGAEYRAGKIGKVVRMKTRKRRTTAKRKKIIRRVKSLHKREGKAIRSLGSVAHHIAKAKAQLKEQIGWAEAQKFAAAKKVSKRKIGKKIAVLKSKYRKLC